jgi:DNA polymerase-3 subunit alpha
MRWRSSSEARRVLGHSYGEVDRIAKASVTRSGSRGTKCWQSPRRSATRTRATRPFHRLIDLAKQLEGVARSASTHAAGVVISRIRRDSLTELKPLARATNSDALVT